VYYYNVERLHSGEGMEGGSPWRKLRELGVKVPKEFAVLPPMMLDRISTDWVLGPGNDLLTHYMIEQQWAIEERAPSAEMVARVVGA
jgi:hypothetical protein